MTAMRNADHLAGALTLEIGLDVTWHRADFSNAAIFQCNGRLAIVGLNDIARLTAMRPEQRKAMVRRMRMDLDPTS
jgi:hypothetical protein